MMCLYNEIVKISLLPRQERSLNTYLLKSCTYITLHMSLYTPSTHIYNLIHKNMFRLSGPVIKRLLNSEWEACCCNDENVWCRTEFYFYILVFHILIVCRFYFWTSLLICKISLNYLFTRCHFIRKLLTSDVLHMPISGK